MPSESAASEAWWPAGGPLCDRTDPHPEHYVARMFMGAMWTDGVCDGKGGWAEGECGRPRRMHR